MSLSVSHYYNLSLSHYYYYYYYYYYILLCFNYCLYLNPCISLFFPRFYLPLGGGGVLVVEQVSSSMWLNLQLGLNHHTTKISSCLYAQRRPSPLESPIHVPGGLKIPDLMCIHAVWWVWEEPPHWHFHKSLSRLSVTDEVPQGGRIHASEENCPLKLINSGMKNLSSPMWQLWCSWAFEKRASESWLVTLLTVFQAG